MPVNFEPTLTPTLRDPCSPTPCGPNSECRATGLDLATPSCTCLRGFIGQPPSCRPECIINSECPSEQACINQKCRDPCPGACGFNAICRVINHTPTCSCNEGFIGNPFTNCEPKPIELKRKHLCNIFSDLLESYSIPLYLYLSYPFYMKSHSCNYVDHSKRSM